MESGLEVSYEDQSFTCNSAIPLLGCLRRHLLYKVYWHLLLWLGRLCNVQQTKAKQIHC